MKKCYNVQVDINKCHNNRQGICATMIIRIINVALNNLPKQNDSRNQFRMKLFVDLPIMKHAGHRGKRHETQSFNLNSSKLNPVDAT